MPALVKEAISKQIGSNCRRQLFFLLYPDNAEFAAQRAAYGIPRVQDPKPGLEQFRAEGQRWQCEVTDDLAAVFGTGAVLCSRRPDGTYAPCSAREMLAGAQPGRFLAEAEFLPGPSFLSVFGLADFRDGRGHPLVTSPFRPDLIAVHAPRTFTHIVRASDGTAQPHGGDDRKQLQIIDVKLSSEPSAGYYAETVIYSVALAVWLEENGFGREYCLCASPAIWPGSLGQSHLRQARAEQPAPALGVFEEALRRDLEITPYDAFFARVRQVVSNDLRQVLSVTDWKELDAHVDQRCRTCEYLGYDYASARDPESGRIPHPDHCLPLARAGHHLSQIAFVSRGAARALRDGGIAEVPQVAELDPGHATFSAHHGLKQCRHMVAGRARALATNAAIPVNEQATIANLPSFVHRQVFVTVDFETSSALTFALGMLVYPAARAASRGFEFRGNDPRSFARKSYVTLDKSLRAEREQVLYFLEDMAAMLESPAEGTSYQIYVWDELQYRHLCDLVGRHLAAILASNAIRHLAWLFPADEVLAQPSMQGSSSPVSILKNAVRSLVAIPVPHYYTLLNTARTFHHASLPAPFNQFRVHPLFEDDFSDMIPSERAHDVWARTSNSAMTITRLTEAIDARLRALYAVERRLREELRGRLLFRAPDYRAGVAPVSITGSVEGKFWYLFTKLGSVLSDLEKKTIRALLPAEREAKFHSAILPRRLEGQERREALERVCGPDAPDGHLIRVYELAGDSLNAKVKDGDLGFALAPIHEVAFLDRRAFKVAEGTPLHDYYSERERLKTRMSDLCQVKVIKFDPENRIVVVSLDDYNQRGEHLLTFEAAGALDLSRDVILDPVHKDFFTPVLKSCLERIGTPENAPASPEVRLSIGLPAVRSRRTVGRNAPGDFLWDAGARSNEEFLADVAGLRQRLDGPLLLNEEQWRAFDGALSRRCSLIWGPPGTGKSHTLRAIIVGAVAASQQAGGRPLRVGVCTMTYTAADEVIEQLPGILKAAGVWESGLVVRIRSVTAPKPNWDDIGDVDHIVDMPVDGEHMGAFASRVSSENAGPVIVGGTPQQFSKMAHQIHQNRLADLFDLLIIDEASQMSVPHAILPLCTLSRTGALIIAGDPRQLEPIQTATPPLGLEALVGGIYTYFKDRFGIPEYPLEVSYRSNASIVAAVALAEYPRGLRSGFPNQRFAWVRPPSEQMPLDWPRGEDWDPALSRLLDPAQPVSVFIYPDGMNAQQNVFEARLVAALCKLLRSSQNCELFERSNPQPSLRHCDDREFWGKAVGVVTPHRAQQSLIVNLLQAAFPQTDPQLIRDAVDTVERYQGQERDVMLITYAVGDPDSIAQEEEFLLSLNRFNVALSRARCKALTLLTRDLLDHIADDIEVVRSSTMLKRFASSHCSNSDALSVFGIEGELRWA